MASTLAFSLTSGMASTLAFWDSNCAVISLFFASIFAIAASASATAWASFVSFIGGGAGLATGFAMANAGAALPLSPFALGLRASRCRSCTQRSDVGAKSQIAANEVVGNARASDAATVPAARAIAALVCAAFCRGAAILGLAACLAIGLRPDELPRHSA